MDGHINETVEWCKFCRRTQQHGETSNDYLISLQDLAKTCKVCSNASMQKNIRDQITEGLLDGNTVEDLLQELDLTLATTITKCKSKLVTDSCSGSTVRSHSSISESTYTRTIRWTTNTSGMWRSTV